jgi:tetratricopeptide (TPR) repeat protein
MSKVATLFFIVALIFTSSCQNSEEPSEAISPKTASSQTTLNSAVSPTASPSLQSPPGDTGTQPASALKKPTKLLHAPTELSRFEVVSEALQQWYNVRKTRPALVLYSNDPFLQQTTPLMQKNLLARLENQEQEALRFGVPNPAILPPMAIDAALQTDQFSAVYWIMPAKVQASELSVEAFRQQMLDMGALNDEEARSLTLRDGVFSGTVRGVPFQALHPQADIPTTGPIAFHFDLSYLAPLYKNEIKTPLYPLLYKTLKHLRAQNLQVVSTTFSYAQTTGVIPLGSRFIGDIFDHLFRIPAMLDEPPLPNWRQHTNALYLSKMTNNTAANKLLKSLAASQPEDASLHFALYQVSREVRKEHNAVLGHLADAVQLEPVYAFEYLSLAPLAREKGQSDRALHILGLANEALPDNPFITLDLARAYMTAGENNKAIPLLQSVNGLSWSSVFYPEMSSFLEQLLAEASR